MKRLTGDKSIKARFMHQNFFTFPVQFKIWMLVNAKPQIRGTDEGIWSRIRIIPFDAYIAKEDRVKGLSEILVQEEGPGILAWCVEGAREWWRIGLSEPKAVNDATEGYRSEQDIIGDFLQACCTDHRENEAFRDRVRVRAIDLYNAYVEWCREMGERDSLTARKFYVEITKKGFPSRGVNSVQYRWGLDLKDRGEWR